MKTIRDAVHGDITLDRAEIALLDTPVFQRLRGIKQLGASYLVFPSACHSRFEHSLGALWMTKRLLNALHEGGHSLALQDQRLACLAALLHDITHVPFGHTFEDERRLFDRHDEDGPRLREMLAHEGIARVLDDTGVGDGVERILLGAAGAGAPPPFVSDLVRGAISADLLDYLKRDALFCGLALSYDDRLLRCFHLAEQRLVFRLHKHGGFRRDALSELVHLLQMRYTLTERVYYHHAKVVAGAMISRALELAMDAGAFDPITLRTLRDDSFLDRLRQASADVAGLADLLDDLDSRRLYKRVYFLTLAAFGRPGLSPAERDALCERFHANRAARQRAEQTLADELRVPAAHVIVYCPSPRMSLKEADVPVELAPGDVRPLSSLGHPDIEALKEKHRGLWRFYVCLRREHADRHAAAGRHAAALFGHANQLERQRRGGLAF